MDNPPGPHPRSSLHSARTAVAAVLSLLLARALSLPEFYWAPISTIVILLSPSDPFTLAWQRFPGRPGRGRGRLDRHLRPCQLDGLRSRNPALRTPLRPAAPGRRLSFCRITLSIVLLIAHAVPPWSSPITASWKCRSVSRWRYWSQTTGACRGRQSRRMPHVTTNHVGTGVPPVQPSEARQSCAESADLHFRQNAEGTPAPRAVNRKIALIQRKDGVDALAFSQVNQRGVRN